jgi:hypothetical protein
MERTIPRDRREAWIADQVAQGIHVIISHPDLVATGLDLWAFPSLFWFSTGYKLFTLWQASRRAWRIGQTAPCRVRFYANDGSFEQTALHLMAAKLDAARVLEGQLTLEGLQQLHDQTGDHDLVRALVQGLDTVPDIRHIWRTITPPGDTPHTPSPPVIVLPRPSRRRAVTPTTGQLGWAFLETAVSS